MIFTIFQRTEHECRSQWNTLCRGVQRMAVDKTFTCAYAKRIKRLLDAFTKSCKSNTKTPARVPPILVFVPDEADMADDEIMV